jgi:hypothetical protein
MYRCVMSVQWAELDADDEVDDDECSSPLRVPCRLTVNMRHQTTP